MQHYCAFSLTHPHDEELPFSVIVPGKSAHTHSLRRAQESNTDWLALRETFQTPHALFIFHSHPLYGVA